MTPNVYQSEVVAGVLASTISMAITTWQAAVRMGGSLDRSYLFGVFSTSRAAAKALSLPWSRIMVDSLCDLEELEALVHRKDLANKPLHHLIDEIETELIAVS